MLVRRLAGFLESHREAERAAWLRRQAGKVETRPMSFAARRARRELEVQLWGGYGSIINVALDSDAANEQKWDLIEQIRRCLENEAPAPAWGTEHLSRASG